jgi:ankyrin repeat protein
MLRFLTIVILCPIAAWAQESDSVFAAIRRNDAAAVEVLLHSGADPNARNPEGATALMCAAILILPEAPASLFCRGLR